MGQKLLPLSMQELCAHALELERDAGARFRQYAERMREIGAQKLADEFDAMSRAQAEEARALQAAAGGYPPAELTPWEHAWRLAYLPDGDGPRAAPLTARDALQFAALAKRRAEAFYREVADNARDEMVRSCAQEMGSAERRQILRLEWLLEAEGGEAAAGGLSQDGDGGLRR
jgi:rubrerythrin